MTKTYEDSNITKLIDTIKTLTNKVEKLEKKLENIEVNYDTVIDWNTRENVLKIHEARYEFNRELKAVPYNTVLMITGTLQLDIFNEKTGAVYCKTGFCNTKWCDPYRSDLPAFKYDVDNTEQLLVPAFHKVKLIIRSGISANVDRYSCYGSKEMRINLFSEV